MELKYIVHSATQEDFAAEAIVAGRLTAVKVPGLVVELVSEDGTHSPTLRFVPEDTAEALELFSPNRVLKLKVVDTGEVAIRDKKSGILETTEGGELITEAYVAPEKSTAPVETPSEPAATK